MVLSEPSRLARLLQSIAACGLFLLVVGKWDQATASCGDYLAGSHSAHGDGPMTSEGSDPMPPTGNCSCKSGQCEASLPLSEQTPTVSVKYRDCYGIDDDANDKQLEIANRWRRPCSSTSPLSPTYSILSPPPELA